MYCDGRRSATAAQVSAARYAARVGGALEAKRRMEESLMERSEFVRQIPKVDLYAPLVRSVRAETLAEIASGHGVDVQAVGVAAALREAGDFQRVARESMLDAAGSGVRHREIFWCPTEHRAQAGIDYATAVDGLRAGLAEAEAECGISGRLIPAIRRDEPPEIALEMVEQMVENPRAEAPGIGLVGPESGNPPEKFWRAYALADRSGLWRTANAGEGKEHWRNIETALDLLSCDRIGHGHAAVDALPLLTRCQDEEVVFTVSLEGGNETAARLQSMQEAGLRLSPSSGGGDLAEVWASLMDTLELSLVDCRHLQAAGIAGAWVDHLAKRRWSHEWAEEFDTLLAQVE